MDFPERAARNEEVFRGVNERIASGGSLHGVTRPMPFHCECDRDRCFESITILPREYLTIADERYRFVIAPGHEDPRIERVVEVRDGYTVVEKVGEARQALDREHPQERHRRD
jgi:hypothetical protein